ncbi:CapA family protein [Geomonas sp. RF6]|uniref:CapA family protein n=1 Tax=Geomonas sp. RF6 TaxID=2897342 RepID=UPI001E5D4775|nr:CapA family protein [Geomonas sp. RF6]UFS69520.1 CapA family protein [Geomonas sp. RF6]
MTDSISIFLCGDVMTGRGIDQLLPHPSPPHVFEPYVRDARIYIELAQRANGPVEKPVPYSYIWGDALDVLRKKAPDLRIVNLETCISTSEEYWIGKGINYRMHPQNLPCLTALRIDACALANNHVLDWGYRGLEETLEVLEKAAIRTAGAGRSEAEAAAPAVLDVQQKGRVLLFSYGSPTSGVPYQWGAGRKKPGVNLLPELSVAVQHIAAQVAREKREGDTVIVSVHWGANWDFGITESERRFAQGLVEEAGVDVVYGHSSHHVKGIEVHRGKLILYGCGDFLNDYEGIRGYEEFRGDLGLMYFVTLSPRDGMLQRVELVPTRLKRLRVNLAEGEDAQWLAATLNREGKWLGTSVDMSAERSLLLRW